MLFSEGPFFDRLKKNFVLKAVIITGDFAVEIVYIQELECQQLPYLSSFKDISFPSN